MGKRKKELEVFADERRAIAAARRELQADIHQSNELKAGYAALLERYEKFMRETGKIWNISDSQSLALMRMETELKSMLDSAGQGFLTIDGDLKVQKQSSAECKRILGRKLAGQPFAELIWPNDPDRRGEAEALLAHMLENEADAEAYAKQLPCEFERNGLLVRIEYKRIVKKAGDEDDARIMIILTDVTEQQQSRERLEYLSTHDTLTGLYNRSYIERRMNEGREPVDAPLSMIMTDMNGLKLVNDVFGHLRGDELLVRSASLLKRSFGAEAVCVRWGGDEFLVLLPGADAKACAEKVALLNEACAATAPDPIKISMAIGTATARPGARDYAQLFQQAEKEMYKKKLIESRNVRKKLIEDISETMYETGIEDPAHIERLTTMAVELAERLGISRNSAQMNTLQLLVKLHDVGKMAIPREVFRHDRDLTPQQWDIMRTHSEIGYRLAFSLGEPALAEAILSMHERWDGKGYPYGLQQEQIPEMSRLLALVDAYDIMTHAQSYRKPLTKEEAIGEIMEKSGTQFDPLVVEVFVSWIDKAM
ncbi:diguanylate cyclase domain-containing protein [Cohnella sp. GCM10027633]|uniref:bifunctional diguanylate cyclase/phosphohydrolase n=1 Tax=unclassified Cohnella TaxID=2636738 RepID=UPI00362D1EE9